MDILIIDDEEAVRESTRLALEVEDHYVEAIDNGKTSLIRLKEDPFDLVLLDLNLGDENGLDVLAELQKRFPRIPVVMFTAEATIDSAVKAIQIGAMDYLEKPFTPDQLRSIVARARNWGKLRERIEELEVEVSTQSPPAVFESNDSVMSDSLELLFRAAPTAASLLVLGESGTGKSIVAREIHQRSHLKSKPFVTISCPSLSKELLESELFGHVKGSFTGAVRDKWGKVHEANGGTLFLDEIGELPMDIQPKLLRLLQEREYERLGETKTRQAEVRVIAATNRDLKKCVEEGTFREDLYYRLNVIAVEMPPLRARPKDLRNFSENFVNFFAKQTSRNLDGFSDDGLAALLSHNWPGNLRELRNAIERAVILCRGTQITAADLPKPEDAPIKTENGSSASTVAPGGDVTIEELEEEHIRRVLTRASTLQDAASILGIDQATLYRKRKKLGID
ncbi:MAG: sigma-54-dependent Fis family transcriptional regulator [Verrucomicrobiales bacterium]|nr:sigma-54-dependent Fis family transcriptional regulator [Verrucomicrobiales bacterium]